MKRFAYRINGLAGEVFIDLNQEVKELAIFCFGFPGNIGKNVIVEYFVSQDYAVFVHQYSGTYDSDGLYHLESSIDSIVLLSKIINNGNLRDIKNNKVIPLNSAPLTTLTAHSFGCLIGGRAATKVESISKIVLFAPILGYGKNPTDYAVLEDGIFQLEYVKRARPHTFRFGKLNTWSNLFNGKLNSWNVDKTYEKKIISIVGSEDDNFNIKDLENNYDNIIKSVFKLDFKSDLIIVDGAGHSEVDFLTDEVKLKIREFLK